MKFYLAMLGTLEEGYLAVGPFVSREAAQAYIDTDPDNAAGNHVMELIPPCEEDAHGVAKVTA